MARHCSLKRLGTAVLATSAGRSGGVDRGGGFMTYTLNDWFGAKVTAASRRAVNLALRSNTPRPKEVLRESAPKLAFGTIVRHTQFREAAR